MATFLLEVGAEELPATFVDGAIAQWHTQIPQALQDAFLPPDNVKIYGTPRRLAVLIEGLPTHQPDRREEIKGPPVQAAFNDGKPTKAAEGFARKQGVAVEDFEIRPTPKGAFIFINKQIAGQATSTILSNLIPQWITGLEGKRFMRWSDGDLRFPRPIRWLVALLDEAILPIRLENGREVVESDRYSQGHRVLHPTSVTLTHAQSYVEIMESAFVLVDSKQRRHKIQQDIIVTSQTLNGQAEIPEDLLNEVTNLVEWPTAVVGKFDQNFLTLPPEVITTVMITHQRYFPVYKSDISDLDNLDSASATHAHDYLLPYFVTISNGDPAKSDIIAAGNERVIQARLADGQFFYKTDCHQSLAAYLSQLETVTFEESLGSVSQKVERILQIANQIASQLQVSDDDRALIQRSAQLCKADLVTQMVYEFPELQGIMGQKYGIVSAEPEAVSTALFEHYLPRGAGDRLPQNRVSQVIALADRLDTLVSIFGLGMLPTGSSDPFALRRAANAIVNILWTARLPLNLQHLLEHITANFCQQFPAQKTDVDVLRSQLAEFFLQRIRTLLQEEQAINYDLVNAVLGDGDAAYAERALQDLLDVHDRAQFLQTIRHNGQLDQIYETVNRSTRLAVQGNLGLTSLSPQDWVNPSLFQQPTEQALYQALLGLLPQTQAAQTSRNYQILVDALITITPTVKAFFDGDNSVLIMDPDSSIRENRLNLLGLLRNHARVLADFGAIVKGN